MWFRDTTVSYNERSICNNLFVALTPQETKKSHDFRPKNDHAISAELSLDVCQTAL